MQAGLAAGSDAPPDARRISFRIGVHLGDVIEKPDGTIYRDGVNFAARLQALARPGGLVVSQSVHTAVQGRLPALFSGLREQSAKNIARPVRAFASVGDRGGAEVGLVDAPPGRPSRRRLFVGAAIGSLLAGAGAGTWWWAARSHTPRTGSPTALAVLPFRR